MQKKNGGQEFFLHCSHLFLVRPAKHALLYMFEFYLLVGSDLDGHGPGLKGIVYIIKVD